MRYILTIVFTFICVLAHAENWQDVQLYNNGHLNQSLDQTKVLKVLTACAFKHFTDRQYNISGLFRLHNDMIQYDSDKTVYHEDGNPYTLEMVRFSPTIYFSGRNLSDRGTLIVHLCMRFYSPDLYYCFNADNYIIPDFSFSDDVNVTELLMYQITQGSDWPYPLFYYTSPSSLPVSFYLTKNLSSNYPVFTPVLSSDAQSPGVGNALQLVNPNFSQGWIRSCMQMYGPNSSVSQANNALTNALNSQKRLYLDLNLTQICAGSPPASNGVAGYVSYNPLIYNLQNDFDRGGQCDWSEYYSNKDMRNPQDDTPNSSQFSGDGTDLPIISPPSRPGETTIEGLETEEIEAPTQEGFTQLFNELSSRMDSTLEQNAGYRSFKRTISQDGFVTKPLPSYQFPMSVSMFGGTMDLGNISIDLNFLREQPYADVWQLIRGILNFSLFTMTFLAVYEMYEKALAWSV